MNGRLQRKLFTCPRCRARYLHDHGYRHDLFQCVKRRGAPNQGRSLPMLQALLQAQGPASVQPRFSHGSTDIQQRGVRHER